MKFDYILDTQKAVLRTIALKRIKSDIFIFHETTHGPFNKSDTLYAPWSPEEKDFKKIDKFVLELKESAKTFKG